MIYKRGNVYWTRFGIDGKMFFKPLGTGDWREAKQEEKKVIAAAQAGKVVPSSVPFARMPFKQALALYRRDRAPNLSEPTRRSELDHSKPIEAFFGDTRLHTVTEEMIRDYIAARHKAGKSNAKINKELYILRGMLKRAKRWRLFSDEIKPLKVPESTVGRALELDERLKLMRAGESNPRWQRALLAAQLSLNTTMRRGEVRKLQWKDVDLIEKWVSVRKGKSLKAARVIPLNPDALDAILKLRQQAKAVFGDELSPSWFVFFWWPATGEPDPTRPALGWRSAWRSLVKAAGIGRLRFHDLRHTAITDLAEGVASEQTITSIAGHMDRRMMEHYSHIRKQARRAAVDALYRKNRVTAQPTVQLHQNGAVPLPQVIGKNGGDDGTRTRGLCRDSAAL